MAKNWWIKLEVGDWKRDVDALSLEAEGAVLELIFKLDSAPLRGRFEFAFDSLSNIFRTTVENAKKIIGEIHKTNVLNVIFLENGNVMIESRRMLKEADLSRKNSANGKKGGRGKKKTKSETKANQKPNESESMTIDSLSDYDSGSLLSGESPERGEISKMIEDQEFISGIFHRYGIKSEDQQTVTEHYERSRIVKAIQHDTPEQARADFQNYVSSWTRKEKDGSNGVTTIKGENRLPKDHPDAKRKENQIMTNGQEALLDEVLKGKIQIQ